MNRSEDETEQRALLAELVGELAENAFICPPLYCTYGRHIHLGERSYINMGATLLDNAPIRIGAEVMIGPNAQIYTAAHPVAVAPRVAGVEFGKPVRIGNNVWIGGSVVICPGVTIGDNSVIGAGSVVTRDIPANVVAVGNPCKVLRPMTAEELAGC